MNVQLTWTDSGKAGDYVVPNVLSSRNLVSSPDNMDETVPSSSQTLNQRTNGPVNAHLISWPSIAQNIQNLEIYGKEMTLTYNSHIPSFTQLVDCIYQLAGHWMQ